MIWKTFSIKWAVQPQLTDLPLEFERKGGYSDFG